MPSVPTNTPPEVQEQMDKMAALMRDEDTGPAKDQVPENEGVSFEDGPFNETTTREVVKPAPTVVPKAPAPRTYKLTLTHDLYKVTFMVQDVSVADYQLAIKVPKTDFRFEPQPNSRFELECMGRSYDVVYLGGLFDFPSDSSWSITFMLQDHLNNQDNSHDNTWTSDPNPNYQ